MTVSSAANPYKYRGRYRTCALPACHVSVADLTKLYRDLEEKTREALEIHLSGLAAPPDGDATEFESFKRDARSKVHLTVTLYGAGGEQIMSESVDALKDEYLPDRLNAIVFDSSTSMQAYNNVTPLNRFTVRLDFTEPPGFFAYNPWDQPTPNGSGIEVIGDNDTWATGVYESTLRFFRNKATRRGWLHRQHFYNAAHWVVGLPAALWVAYRAGSLLSLLSIDGALKVAIYVYLLLLSLLVFRLTIWALRWIFPVVELEGSRSKKARVALGSLIASVLVGLAIDVMRSLF